jgi:hypothetical protein
MSSTLKASDVLGRYLIAQEDVPVYDLPNGTRIGEIKKGNSTAEVFSYVQRGNDVWWAFDYTVPGKTPGSYYVLHKPNRFKLSAARGNVIVTPASLPSVDVFPKAGFDLKKYAVWGGLGLLALLVLKK